MHQTVSDPRWQEEYGRRVAGVMDQLCAADDRIVFWVRLPPMRDGGFDGRVRIMNDIYRDAAEDRPWVTYVDTAPVFGTPTAPTTPPSARATAST